MLCAPASMLSSAARITLGIPMFREFLSNATLFRFTLSRVMDIFHRHNDHTISRKRPPAAKAGVSRICHVDP